jgi:hypothetical protein
MDTDVDVDVATRTCEMAFRDLPDAAASEKEWRLAQMDADRLEVQGAPAKALWTARRALARAEGIFQLIRQKQQGALNSLLYMYGSGDVKVLRIDRELIVGMPGTLAPYYARRIRGKCGRSVPVAGHVSGHLPGEVLEPEAEARGEFSWVPSPFAAASAVKMADAAAALISGT